MMFGGQTSKNINDVGKVLPWNDLVSHSIFVEFYVFNLDKIDVKCPKLVYDHIQVGNVTVNIPKDQPRVLEEEPFTRAKSYQTSPIYGWQSTTRRWCDEPYVRGVGWNLSMRGFHTFGQITHPNHPPIGRSIGWVTVRTWPGVDGIIGRFHNGIIGF